MGEGIERLIPLSRVGDSMLLARLQAVLGGDALEPNLSGWWGRHPWSAASLARPLVSEGKASVGSIRFWQTCILRRLAAPAKEHSQTMCLTVLILEAQRGGNASTASQARQRSTGRAPNLSCVDVPYGTDCTIRYRSAVHTVFFFQSPIAKHVSLLTSHYGN